MYKAMEPKNQLIKMAGTTSTTKPMGEAGEPEGPQRHRRPLHLYASELAALAGRHRYQPREDALHKVLKRVDPRCAAARRCQPSRAEVGQHVFEQLVATDARLRTAVEAATATAGTVSSGDEVRQAADALVGAASTAGLAGGVVGPQGDAVAEHCRSLLYTTYGTRREAPVTESLKAALAMDIVKDNVYHMRSAFKTNGFSVSIGGKCDGICTRAADGLRCVLEVKNRVNCLFGSVPDYEYVQVMAYMFVTGIHEALLVEQRGEERCVHKVVFDAPAWDALCASLREAVEELEGLLLEA